MWYVVDEHLSLSLATKIQLDPVLESLSGRLQASQRTDRAVDDSLPEEKSILVRESFQIETADRHLADEAPRQFPNLNPVHVIRPRGELKN